MDWNHRVIRHVLVDETSWLAIHEVYYDDNDKPDSCTKEPIQMVSNDLNEMEWTVDKIKEALKKPIIDYTYFEELEKRPDEG